MAKDAMAKAFGGGEYDAPEGGDEADAMTDEDDSGLPADYESAYADYEAAPSAQTFWDAVEACTAAGKSGGSALLIGMGKPKKN